MGSDNHSLFVLSNKLVAGRLFLVLKLHNEGNVESKVK